MPSLSAQHRGQAGDSAEAKHLPVLLSRTQAPGGRDSITLLKGFPPHSSERNFLVSDFGMSEIGTLRQ